MVNGQIWLCLGRRAGHMTFGESMQDLKESGNIKDNLKCFWPKQMTG